MKPHARFLPMDELKAVTVTKDQKLMQQKDDTKAQTTSLFCFPTIESLLSKDTNSQFPIRQNTAKISPYDIMDNQIIFDNQSFRNNRNVRTATISPRASKSPPPVHTKQYQNSATQVSIDNFNPNKFTPFTETLTLEAITSLGLTQDDLFYQPFHTVDEKNRINDNINLVRREREKIAFKTGKFLPQKHQRNLSPPVRRTKDFPETFVFEANPVPKQFLVCGNSGPKRNEKKESTQGNGQRVHTADIRRGIKTHKLVL